MPIKKKPVKRSPMRPVSQLEAGDETEWWLVIAVEQHGSGWRVSVQYPDGSVGIRHYDEDVEVKVK